MFKAKKILFIGLVLIVALVVLAACGNGGAGNNKSAVESSSSSSGKSSSSSGDKVVTQGITDDKILVGHIGPQTGPTAIYDLIRKGIDSYFNYVNENGGVHGRQLELIAYDDQYQPAQTVQQARRIVEEDKVFAIVGHVCTPCMAATKEYYKEIGIPLVMIASGAQQFVDPTVPNIFGSHLVNYHFEARVFLDYAVKELGAKKIAIAYQNDDFGKEGYEATKIAIHLYDDVEIVEEVNFLASDVELSSQAQRLKEADPDVVLVFAVANPAANLKKAMYTIGFTDVVYIAASAGANDNNLFNLAGEEVWNGTISSAPFPMPDQSDDPSMKLYVERFSKDYPNDPLAGIGQWGWSSAEVFVEALRRVEGDITWENLTKAFYTFDNWEGSMFEGITFSEDNHYGITSLFMTQAIDGEIVPISDTIYFDPASKRITYSKE